MHEISLVAELMEACERVAANAPVRRVRVRHASTIPEPVLRQAFDLLAMGTAFEGVTLDTTSFDLELRCGCGFVGRLDHDELIGAVHAVCPSCGDLVRRAPTPELELLEVVTG